MGQANLFLRVTLVQFQALHPVPCNSRHVQLNRNLSLLGTQIGLTESSSDPETSELPSWMHLKLTSTPRTLEEEMDMQRKRSEAISVIQPTGLARIMQAVLPCEYGAKTMGF